MFTAVFASYRIDTGERRERRAEATLGGWLTLLQIVCYLIDLLETLSVQNCRAVTDALLIYVDQTI